MKKEICPRWHTTASWDPRECERARENEDKSNKRGQEYYASAGQFKKQQWNSETYIVTCNNTKMRKLLLRAF